MSTSWRQRALERNREANRRFFAELASPPSSDDAYEEELRRNWLEAARHYDPQAALSEELTVRLRGEAAERGALDFRVGDALLRPLRDGVAAAARKDVELELTGLSRGSTVLHVRPKVESSEEEANLGRVDSSTADPAMRDLLKLVDAAENEQDVRRWERIIPGLDGVVHALDRFDLSMEMRWRSLDGTVRSSSLSSRGKSYMRSLRELKTYRSRLAVAGTITELRMSGIVKVKTGNTRQSKAYDVHIDPDDLMAMHLELGMPVSFLIEVVKKKDQLGRERSTEYRFVRVAETQDGLFET
ncbi:hypothetical protein [Streptomyces sp. CCM_MD2014]|uniref:hypothetical protein n=1 Tax=Streptomyces sp. CCM_MD2014 TaxID=1561022 RepID=UPI00052A8D51|nr:hypothetical protein [Streptomyces sp. CCM_MD2014]AIV35990.1 hypothetical protein NI25_23020 [Streptomyces sp. CCM_MD2014]